MKPFFSIIIPVYNVELYLIKCLDSVLSQEFSSFEVICIDDGSTDNSSAILNEYTEKDSRIRTKTIKNGGTARARNEGIKMASGEYILFVDSDDWIESNSLSVLFVALKKTPADILSFNGSLYYEKTGMTEVDKGKKIDDMTGWEYFNRTLFRKRKFHFVCVVIRAYRADYLKENELWFEPGILHEDNLFTPIAFHKAKNVFEIPDNLYYYRIREESKMHEYSYRQIVDKAEVNNQLGDYFFSKSGIELNSISQILASTYINLYSSRVRSVVGKNHRKITEMINKKYFRKACIITRHKFLYLLIRIHPSAYRAYIRIMQSVK